jgi:uncharacterized lipoprotein YddW (UPF0748 family)
MPFWRVLQDWDGWLRNGLVDAVFPMNYFRAHEPEHAQWFAGWMAYQHDLADEVEARIVPGPAGYLNSPANATAQVRTAMHRGDGAMVYSFQQPTIDHSREIWRELADTRWGYRPLP